MKYTPEQIKEKIREGKYNFDFEGTKRGNETRRSAEEIQNEIRNKTYQGIDYDHIAEIKRQVAERNSFVPNKNTSHSNLQRAAEQRIKNEAAQKNSLSNDMSYEEKNKSLRNQEWKAYGKRLLTGLGYIASDENSRDITYRDYQNARQQHKEIKAQHDELKQNRQNEIQAESKRLIEEDAEISNLVKKAYSARATASEKTQNAAQSDDLTSAMMSLFNKDELGYDTSKQDRELKESKKQLNDILKQKNASLDADELIAYYTNNQNILKSQNTAEGFNKAAQEHPVILGAVRVLSSPYASIANAATTIGDLVTDGDYVYSGANSIHDARRGIKSGIEDKLSNADLPNLSALPGIDENNDITILDKNYGNVYSSLYDAIDMGAESAYNSLIMGGGLTGGIRARGLSEKIIQAGATGSFTSATMGEQTAQLKASGENIKDVYAETGKDAIINFAGEMIGTPLEKYDGVIPTIASEALEEVIGNAVSNLDDVIRLQDEGEIKQTYNKYIAEGKSESQALSLTVKELLADDIYVAGMAAVSSFGMAGGQSVLNSAQENNIYRSVGNELKKSGNAQAEINAGLAQDNTSKAYQAAAKLQSNLEQNAYTNNTEEFDYSQLNSRKLGRLAEYNAQEDARQLEKSAEVFEGDTAKSYVYAYGDNGYNGNVYDYNKGFNAVYMAQQQGKSINEAYDIALDEGSHITPIQATIAYDAAKNDTAVAEFKDALSSPIKIGATVVAKSVDKEQQSTINFIDEMAKLAGVEVVIPARMQDVGLKDANGAYTNGKIVLPLDNESKMMNIYLGHEMFHHFKVTAPESADFLQNTVIERLKADASYNYEERLAQIINDYGFKGTREQQVAAAHEEMAANACFTVFSDEANVKQLVAQDRTLAQKVRDFFADLVDRMKKAISVISNNAEYNAFYDKKSMQEIVDLFDNCLKETQKNNTATKDGVRYSFKETKSGMANDNLLPYDNELKRIFEKRGDIVVDSYEKLVNVVNIAFNEPNKKATAYFGILNKNLLDNIQNDIPNLPQNLKGNLFKPNSNYSIAATLDSIRHLIDDKSGMTQKDVINYLDKFADTLIEYDSVYYDVYYDSMKKQNKGLLFKKEFDNGTYQSFNIISNKKKSLSLVTLYMDKLNYKKKKSAETLHLQNTDAHTPKAGVSQTSNNNVPQSETSVNSNDMQDKAKYSLKEDNNQTAYDDVNIEEYFDEEFYDRFKYEDNSKITKSVEQLERESNELWDLAQTDKSYYDDFYPVKYQLNALKAGFDNVRDYVIEERKKSVRKYPKQYIPEIIKKRKSKNNEQELLREIAQAPAHKAAQFKIIQESNPAPQESNYVWIRRPSDIKTFEETLEDVESFTWGDFTKEDAIKAIKRDLITVYSSYPIKNGVFVSTSYVQAQQYAGGEGGKVYSKTIKPSRVAWINGDEGQYASVRNSNAKFSLKEDSDGNKLSEQQQEYFKDSKVRDENGNLLVVYHGTPNANFTKFRSSSYFTQNKEYAQRYQSPGASSLSVKTNMDNPDTYKVYLNIKKPFDTRNADEREIFENEFYMKWGNGAPLSKRGLPDWVEAMDLQEFIEENEYDYDGLIVDEGGEGGYGMPVYDRGLAYVTFFSNQVKSVDNLIPTDSDDIRYSLKEQPYSYEALTSKPDMKITEIDDSKKYMANSQTRKDIINQSIENAKKIGIVNENGNAVIYVDDIDKNIIVPKGAIKHSLDRRLNVNAHISLEIGKILKKSICINEMIPRTDNIEKSYVLIGIAKNKANEPYVVSFVVNKITNEVSAIDVLYAVNAKKEPTGSPLTRRLSPQVSTPATGSTISISDLLDYVNKYYPDILPEDVLKHYGYKGRPEGVLGESALYSIKEKPIDYNAVIEENAELSEMNEDLKEMLRLTSAQNEKLKNEFKITDRHNISNNAVDKVAAALRKQYSSSYDKTSLVSRLAAMYDYMANAGKDIDSTYIWLRANDIAKNIIANSQQKDTAVYDEYKELRNRIRNTAIRVPQTVQDNFADYNAFRRENFGRLRLSKEGVELDAFYNELSAQYPEFFDTDVSEEQQLEALANFFEVTAPVYYSASEKNAESMGMNMEQYANLIAGDIIDKYFDVPEVLTAAEKHKKEMDTLKLHYRNQIDDMRQSYKNRYEERLREVKAENAKRVTKLRADKADALAKQKAHFEDVSQRGKERRKKSQLRNSIRNSLNKIARLGAKPDKKKHIPNSIIDSVKALADAVNFDDTKQDNRLKERLNAFQDSFEAVEKNDQYSVISELYNDFIHSKLSDLKEEIGNTPLKELPVSTLEKMDELFKMTVQSINNINRLFLKDRNETIEKYAENISNELAPYKKEKMYKGMSKSLMYNSMKPEYFFQYLGSDTLLELYHNLRKGEDVWAVDISEARDYALKVRKKYGWQKWDNKHSQSFNTSYGEIELTLQERLAVYANSLGEHTKNHLYGGGFRYQKSEQKGLKKLRKQVNDNENHRLSESDVELIVSSLDENQKAYVRDMMNYLSIVMGQKGNEVSKELYGIEMFKEKMYYPAKVLKESTHQSTKEVRAEKQLKNAGFTNSSVKNAKQPLVLMDFDSVWASHVDEMSKYHAFVLPLENIDRVYNLYNVTDDYEFTSIKQIIENAYGDKALTYIDDLIKDINGGVVHEAGTDFISKATSLFKKNAVFASASVAVQQPSAIARAFSEVNFKYFVKVTGSGFSRKSYNEMKKYAPIAIIKEMGYFDTNMARSTVDFLNNNDYEGVKEKLKAFVKDGSYRDEALSFFASKADEITWTHIWNACKAEVKANNSELTKEQQLEKAGERFTEVVTKTQVYDSVFSRSGLMRSRDSAVKNATAFMAEPTTSLNMLANAVVQAKRGNISKAKAGRVFASLVTASVFNSLLQTIVTAARADDDDKDWAEVYLAQLIPNFIDNLNPFNQIAFIKDIFNIFQGYDVTRADMNLFSDLADAIDKLDSDKISVDDKIKKLAGATAAFFGLPVKNILRDFDSFKNIVNDFRDDKKYSSETAFDLFKEEMNSVFGFELFNADLDIALKAVKKGDTQTYREYADKIYATDDAYDLLYSILVKYGYNSSQYRTAENRCVEIKKQNGAKEPEPKSSMKKKALKEYAHQKKNGTYKDAEPLRQLCIQLYGDMTKVNEALEKLND